MGMRWVIFRGMINLLRLGTSQGEGDQSLWSGCHGGSSLQAVAVPEGVSAWEALGFGEEEEEGGRPREEGVILFSNNLIKETQLALLINELEMNNLLLFLLTYSVSQYFYFSKHLL